MSLASEGSTPNFDVLKEGFFECIREALPLIAARLKVESPPVVQRRTYVRESDQSGSYPVSHSYDLFMFLTGLFEELKELPSVTKLVETIKEQGLGSQVHADAGGNPLPEGQEVHLFVNLYIEPLLADYVGQELVESWYQDRAESAAKPLIDFLQADSLTWITVAPLLNAGGSDDLSFDFSDELKLRLLTQGEMDSLWASGEFGGFIDRLTLTQIKYCLEYRRAELKDPRPASSTAADMAIGNLVTAFHLVGADKVFVPVDTSRTLERTYGLGYGSGGMRGRLGNSRVFGQSELTPEICEAAKLLLPKLSSTRTNRTIRLALDRLDFAAQRARNQDKLLDAWIGLEALFLSDGQAELQYRVSLRMAYYLAPSQAERQGIFEHVRSSYIARSTLVHGDEVAGLGNTATDTFHLLRQALLKTLDDPSSIEPARLNALVLGG